MRSCQEARRRRGRARLQAKLLRAIESRLIRRVGGQKEIALDVRIVCATNRRLAAMVNEGTFREGLYYRLAVVDVTLPPLRARREDIPAIAQHLYAKMSGGAGAPLSAAFVESPRWRLGSRQA